MHTIFDNYEGTVHLTLPSVLDLPRYWTEWQRRCLPMPFAFDLLDLFIIFDYSINAQVQKYKKLIAHDIVKIIRNF